MIFKDRQEAGKKLATELLKYRSENPIVLALPRGGVPIGYEVAEVLHAPLDVIIVRKIGAPGNAEFGIGAISELGVRVLDEETITLMGLDKIEINNVISLEEIELKRRASLYREGRSLPDLKGKTVILVDDGLATGVTANAAINAVKKLNPKKIIYATPVCAQNNAADLKTKIDTVICLAKPLEFLSVGSWYQNFRQISDDEVIDLLKQAREAGQTRPLKEETSAMEQQAILHEIKRTRS